MFKNKLTKPIVFALIIFFLSAVYITYPLVFHLNNYVTGFGDELLIAWIQNHAIFSILHNPLGLFNGNIFYPYQNTIAYSDLFLTSGVMSLIPVYLFKEPITAVNFTLFSSVFILGFSVFSLSYYLTRNFFASFVSGLLVIFSPAILDKKVHLQILTIYWVPFAVISFLHFIKTKKSKWLVVAMFLFIAQTANSFLPGYFLVFFFAVYLIVLFIKDRRKLNLFIQKKNLLILFISFLILLPIVIPYFKVSSDFNFKRDIRDSIHFALQPEDMFVAGNDSKMVKLLPQNLRIDKFHNGEIKPGFLGLAFSALVLGSIVYFLKKKKKSLTEVSLFATGILGLITSFGPAMHWGRVTIHHPFPIPLPYALFYYLLPGFSGFRNSARWEMLFILCLAVLIAIMLTNLLKKVETKKRLIIYCLLAIVIIWEFNFPMKFYNVTPISNFPKVYRYLSAINKPAIFMPVCNWNDKCGAEEFWRVYYSTDGFPRMINGTSGFSPPVWQKRIQEINNTFPSDKSLSLINEEGVEYVVFESNTWQKYGYKNILDELRTNNRLRLIKQFDKTYVFRLL